MEQALNEKIDDAEEKERQAKVPAKAAKEHPTKAKEQEKETKEIFYVGIAVSTDTHSGNAHRQAGATFVKHTGTSSMSANGDIARIVISTATGGMSVKPQPHRREAREQKEPPPREKEQKEKGKEKERERQTD